MTEAEEQGRVLLERDGSIATITLNRPEKLNALEPGMLARLDMLLATIDRDPDIRVVIVTGSGARAFCAGADITAWAALEPLDMWRSWIREGHRVFDRLAALRQPTIVAINGAAFGGGLELALAGDMRLLSEQATLAMPEVTIGTVPGWAGGRRLPDTVGVARAKQMIFSGERIDAATALAWGLVNEVWPALELPTRARSLAERIAENAPVAVQLAKAVIDRRADALEAMAGALAATTGDGREGAASFREKRAPQFRGE